ncbi:Solute carrier family 26 member 6 [Exaiptasia diaphana]|nr:Solute carrier family 26 member 6 [Exaiptasia diaphana]
MAAKKFIEIEENLLVKIKRQFLNKVDCNTLIVVFGKTQMCNFPVVAIILLVLLFAAPLFYTLPKAVLAAVVIVALKGLFKQFSRFCELWKICKYDAAVWISAWLAVVILGIDTGLAVGIIIALLIVLVRSSRPRCVILGHVPHTGIYRDLSRFPGAKEFPGIKIFRFESALFYANAEFFRNELIRKIHLNPDDINKNEIKQQQRVSYIGNGDKRRKDDNDPEAADSDQGADGSVIIENFMNGGVDKPKKSSSDESSEFSDEDMNIPIHTVIIDCSTFNFIDTQGVNLLIQSIDTELSSPPVSANPSIIIPTLPPCPEESNSSQLLNQSDNLPFSF